MPRDSPIGRDCGRRRTREKSDLIMAHRGEMLEKGRTARDRLLAHSHVNTGTGVNMDLEPALEALSLVEDSDAGRRLDLICLDVPRIGDDDQVESKKRKIKKSRRRHLTPVSSPLHPDRQTVGSLSLSEDLPVSRSTSVVESTASSKPEEESLEINRLDEEVVSRPLSFRTSSGLKSLSSSSQSSKSLKQTATVLYLISKLLLMIF